MTVISKKKNMGDWVFPFIRRNFLTLVIIFFYTPKPQRVYTVIISSLYIFRGRFYSKLQRFETHHKPLISFDSEFLRKMYVEQINYPLPLNLWRVYGTIFVAKFYPLHCHVNHYSPKTAIFQDQIWRDFPFPSINDWMRILIRWAFTERKSLTQSNHLLLSYTRAKQGY